MSLPEGFESGRSELRHTGRGGSRIDPNGFVITVRVEVARGRGRHDKPRACFRIGHNLAKQAGFRGGDRLGFAISSAGDQGLLHLDSTGCVFSKAGNPSTKIIGKWITGTVQMTLSEKAHKTIFPNGERSFEPENVVVQQNGAVGILFDLPNSDSLPRLIQQTRGVGPVMTAR